MKHAGVRVGTGTRFSYDGEVVTVVEIHAGDTLLNTGGRLAQRPCGSELTTQDIGANRGMVAREVG